MSFKETQAWNMLRRGKVKAKRLHRKYRPLAKPNSIEKYVFIVTYGRSGSTLLQNVIGRLPGAYILGENGGIPFKLAASYKDALLMEDQIGPYISLPSSPWYGAEFFDAEAFGKKCAKMVYRDILHPPKGTRIAGFKEIRWLDDDNDFDAIIAFLSKYFAPAYFIMNVRDPISTSNSGWWKDMDKDKAVSRITLLRETLMAKSATMENAVVADYDLYTKDSDAMIPVLELLGETYDVDYVNSVLSRKLDHTGV